MKFLMFRNHLRLSRFSYLFFTVTALLIVSSIAYPDWTFIPYYTPDEMFPLRSIWFFDETVAQKIHIKYQDSRIGTTLAGVLLYKIMTPQMANIVFHYLAYSLGLLGLYTFFITFSKPRSALLVICFIGMWDQYIWYSASMYAASIGMPYIFFSLASLARAETKLGYDSRYVFLSGLLIGFAIHSHAYWLVLGAPLLALYTFFSVGLSPKYTQRKKFHLVMSTGFWGVIGFVTSTLILCLLSYSYGGPFVFFYKSLSIMLDNPYSDAVFYKQSVFPAMLQSSWWLYLPVLSLLIAISVLFSLRHVQTQKYAGLCGIAVSQIFVSLVLSYQWLYTAGNYLSKPDTSIFLFANSIILVGALLCNCADKLKTAWVIIGLIVWIFTQSTLSNFALVDAPSTEIFPNFVLFILAIFLLMACKQLWYRKNDLIGIGIGGLFFGGLAYFSTSFNLFGLGRFLGASSIIIASLCGVAFLVEDKFQQAFALIVVYVVLVFAPPVSLKGKPELFSAIHDVSKDIHQNYVAQETSVWFDKSDRQIAELAHGLSHVLPQQLRRLDNFPTLEERSIWSDSPKVASLVDGDNLLVFTRDRNGPWENIARHVLNNTAHGVHFDKPQQILQLPELSITPLKVLSYKKNHHQLFADEPIGKVFGEGTMPIRKDLPSLESLESYGPFKLTIVLRPEPSSALIYNGYNDTSPPMPFIVGPLVSYETERREVYRIGVSNKEKEPFETMVKLPSEEWGRLELIYDGSKMSLLHNGATLVAQKAAPSYVSSAAMIGGGFLKRRWSGQISLVEISSISDPAAPPFFRWSPLP